MILVAVVILVGVFWVATGRGGELAYEYPDYAPLDLGPVSATDVALLRPPTALWGYNMQVTDEALESIAQAIRDRDVTIAFLQQRLADLTAQTAAAPVLPPGQAAAPVLPALVEAASPVLPPAQAASPVLPPAQAAAPVLPPAQAAAPVLPPAQAADPPGPRHPADPPGPVGRAPAQPDDSALAPEEQPR
jgi:hypothetical protein